MPDKIDHVLEMMEYVYKHHNSELCTEKAFLNVFGEERCSDFERYAMGGRDPYATTHTLQKQGYDITTGLNIVEEIPIIVLTQKGVRTIYKIKGGRKQKSFQERIHMSQLHINMLFLAAVGVLAVASVWNMLRDVIQSSSELSIVGLGLSVAIAIILVYIGLISREVGQHESS